MHDAIAIMAGIGVALAVWIAYAVSRSYHHTRIVNRRLDFKR